MKGSTWIPVFEVDTSFDLGGAGKKFTNYVMGMLNRVTICKPDCQSLVLECFLYKPCSHCSSLN